MFELRRELLALKRWEQAGFDCTTQTEIDALAHRIIRMGELIRKIRDLASQN